MSWAQLLRVEMSAKTVTTAAVTTAVMTTAAVTAAVTTAAVTTAAVNGVISMDSQQEQPNSSKHEMLTQCWVNVGPMSQTVALH